MTTSPHATAEHPSAAAMPRLLTLRDVTAATALSRSAVYALMTELEQQLAEALQTLSAQFETEQRQHCAQVEALQQQVERLAGHVTTLTEHCADLAEKLLAQSCHGRMRELRIQSGGRPIRVFYAFDRRRTALLLLGAYKTHPRRFYDDYVPRADLIYDRHLKELLRERLTLPYEPSAMTPRPWSELTKHWSPERKAANERAKAELRADIRRLQAQARKEGRHPGDPPSPGSSSRSPQTPIDPVESRRQPARDVEQDFGPSR